MGDPLARAFFEDESTACWEQVSFVRSFRVCDIDVRPPFPPRHYSPSFASLPMMSVSN